MEQHQRQWRNGRENIKKKDNLHSFISFLFKAHGHHDGKAPAFDSPTHEQQPEVATR